ncbi:hypothetical protein [Xanthobacter tagetidis]|uniref:Uncharacterized protein n=1 Tax=Xanthobacter tagetidis TaxID=60216 RepID=A0A3L7AJF8_9HYPH|nr:hypothetical protein [Xanthobacter tagetidis]MBB6308942.1 hypothetical protein [Xanthobacter tagetidis]RLP80549.1 hypothetical protein D9R14_05740 [Xanthobacter tagetidis]
MHLPDQLSPPEAADAALNLAGLGEVLDRLAGAVRKFEGFTFARQPDAVKAADEGGEEANRFLAHLQTEMADTAATILATMPIATERLAKAQAALADTLAAAAAAERTGKAA